MINHNFHKQIPYLRMMRLFRVQDPWTISLGLPGMGSRVKDETTQLDRIKNMRCHLLGKYRVANFIYILKYVDIMRLQYRKSAKEP